VNQDQTIIQANCSF